MFFTLMSIIFILTLIGQRQGYKQKEYYLNQIIKSKQYSMDLWYDEYKRVNQMYLRNIGKQEVK